VKRVDWCIGGGSRLCFCRLLIYGDRRLLDIGRGPVRLLEVLN
jgi:hypothetical protein